MADKITGNVDYTPWLNSGSDTSAAPGFQGDFSALSVAAASPQTGGDNRIQEAVDLATEGATINVYAGLYLEGNASRNVYTGAVGGYATGLLVYKNGLTIQGVDASGAPITAWGDIAATISATRRDPSAGDTIITGDNVTLSGLRFGPATDPIPEETANKNLWVNADNFTLKNSIVDNEATGYSGLYMSDERGAEHINTFTIDHNHFLYGEITITNGVGQLGDASQRQITNNTIEHVTDWAGISIMGSGVYSWTAQPVGAMTIISNTFSDNAEQIMARGNDYADLNWGLLLAANTFDKAVIALTPGGDAEISDYDRLGWISGTDLNFRLIGSNIQEGVDRAAGDTVLVLNGTYNESQITIDKGITVEGQSAEHTIIDGGSATGLAAPAW